jgi:hypothetical protein
VRCEQPLQAVRQIDIVGVEDGDKPAGGQPQPAVDGIIGVGVLLVIVAEPGIGIALDDTPGAVGRAVVDDDQLQIGDTLGEDAVHRRTDKFFVIIRWDNH